MRSYTEEVRVIRRSSYSVECDDYRMKSLIDLSALSSEANILVWLILVREGSARRPLTGGHTPPSRHIALS